jgi:hypothetical protein
LIQRFDFALSLSSKGMQLQEKQELKSESTGIMFGKIDFGEKKEKKKGPTDAAALLKLVGIPSLSLT